MQKYPRGSRGSPAKGVVPVTVARVRISPSAPKTGQGFFLALVLFCGRRTARNRVFPRGRARRRQRGCPHSFPQPVRRRRFAVSQGNTSPSAPKPGQGFFLALFLFCGRRTARNRVFPRGRARRRQRGYPHPFPLSFADDALPYDRPPPRFARRTLRSRPRPDLFGDAHAARALFPFGTALRLHGVAVLAEGVKGRQTNVCPLRLLTILLIKTLFILLFKIKISLIDFNAIIVKNKFFFRHLIGF